MRLVIVGLILLALIAAGGTALLVKRFLDSEVRQQAEAAAEQKVATSYVIVADNDLPAGETISDGDLRWQPWPDDALDDSFVASTEEESDLMDEYVGAVVRRGLIAGTPITGAMVFKRDDPGFLAGALDPGMRAVAVAVKPERGAAGFILPGDRVDVILTHDVRRDYPSRSEDSPIIAGKVVRYTSETILRDVRVLAIDQEFDDFDEEAKVVKTVTLEVSPKQAETLAVATEMGSISLSLRSLAVEAPAEAGRSFTSDLQISPTLSATFGEREEAAPPPPVVVERPVVRSAPPPPPKPRPAPAKVKIYRGVQETTRELSDR